MKNFLIILALIIGSTVVHAQKNTITTFILVRHAEKLSDGTNNPDLKPEGIERANRLAEILKEVKVDAVYSTNFKRTQNTVLPLAKAKGLEVKSYEPLKSEEIEQMLKNHNGGTILVSGHSNTTPWVANLLTGTEKYKDFDDSDYGNILIVTVVEKGKLAQVTCIRY
jgi:2,3-bisphosphoglycerate-dependent phosphoglycerate mutase